MTDTTTTDPKQPAPSESIPNPSCAMHPAPTESSPNFSDTKPLLTRTTIDAFLFRPTQIDAMREGVRADHEWIWHGYLAPNNITLITSQWKSGKTCLAAVLAARYERLGKLPDRYWSRHLSVMGELFEIQESEQKIVIYNAGRWDMVGKKLFK
jgi:hypothetical protein